MTLKGGSPTHEGDERADAWPLDDSLREIAGALRDRARSAILWVYAARGR